MPIDFLLHIAHTFIETVEASGAAVKRVQCEACAFVYEYEIKRRSRGNAFRLPGGLEIAKQKAQAHLQKALQDGCEPVACPNCGWLQSNMIARARRIRYRWMASTAFCLVPISFIFFSAAVVFEALPKVRQPAPDPAWAIPFWVASGICAVLVVVLAILKVIWTRNYKPNTQNPNLKEIRGW